LSDNEPEVVIYADTRSEQAVIGSCVYDANAMPAALRVIGADDFYFAFHRWVFGIMSDLWKRREPCDVVTVCSEMERHASALSPAQRNALNEPDAPEAYIAECMGSIPHALHVEWYARRVLDMADRRRMAGVLTDVASDIAALDDGVDSAIEDVTGKLREARRNRPAGNFAFLGDVDDVATHGALPRVRVGEPFDALDRMTGGFEPGQMVVVAARPSVGKSAIVVQWLTQIARTSKRPVVLVSLEMPKRDVVNRVMGMLTGINMHALREAGQPSLEQGRAVRAARDQLGALPFGIDDDPDTSMSGVLARAREAAEREQACVLAVDYLQLMHDSRRSENRNQEVARMSAAMKQLARELQIPVIVLAQLNRGVELRSGDEPQLSDLRDSGAIEQDADIVLMLHRLNKDGDVALYVRKNRNGPTGVVPLRFIRELAMFAAGQEAA
jgi:replicative DNA helicase